MAAHRVLLLAMQQLHPVQPRAAASSSSSSRKVPSNSSSRRRRAAKQQNRHQASSSLLPVLELVLVLSAAAAITAAAAAAPKQGAAKGLVRRTLPLAQAAAAAAKGLALPTLQPAPKQALGAMLLPLPQPIAPAAAVQQDPRCLHLQQLLSQARPRLEHQLQHPARPLPAPAAAAALPPAQVGSRRLPQGSRQPPAKGEAPHCLACSSTPSSVEALVSACLLCAFAKLAPG